MALARGHAEARLIGWRKAYSQLEARAEKRRGVGRCAFLSVAGWKERNLVTFIVKDYKYTG